MTAVPKPHILTASVASWGEISLMLICPYTLAERDVRPCLMGLEPTEPCEWHWFDLGEHHKDCPAFNNRDAECSGKDNTELHCWPEEPEECDGFASDEVGHVHPVEGCWAQELISEIGWSEAIQWAKDSLPAGGWISLPLAVDIWIDDGCVTIAPWKREDATT